MTINGTVANTNMRGILNDDQNNSAPALIDSLLNINGSQPETPRSLEYSRPVNHRKLTLTIQNSNLERGKISSNKTGFSEVGVALLTPPG